MITALNILIAEDGQDHARILMAVLKRSGHNILWFQTGTEAYDHIVKSGQPDLLITDVMMPGMSGFELIARLKDENIMPPTIVLTSRQRDEDVLRGLKLGVLDYITKPFSPTVVLAKVENALKRRAS